jgi:protein involved in polysaccharide export with SLBB domain
VHRFYTVLFCLAAAAWPLASGAQPTTTTPTPTPSSAPATGVSSVIGGTDEMRLRPGDVLRIIVYREPDLNGEFLIDEQGIVNLPLIGDEQLAGMTMRQVRDRVIERYRVHLRNPSISVIPLRRIHMLGEVQKPGQYGIDPTVSLAGAVALAGGATPSGDLRKLRIVRDGTVYRDRVDAAVTLSALNIQSGDVVYVERRSWFERNSTFVVSALISATSIVTSIILALTR